MDVVWKKIFRDVFEHRGRTVQVVLSIAVGVFAMGITLGMLDQVRDRMTGSWVDSNPGHVHVRVGEGVDDDVVRFFARMPGAEWAQGDIRFGRRWKRSADASEVWEQSLIHSRADFQAQRFDTVDLLQGQWPQRGQVAMDRGTAGVYGLEIGDTVYFEVENRLQPMTVSGITFSPRVDPPVFSSSGDFYVARDQIDKLGRPRDYTTLIVALPEYSEQAADDLALTVKDRLDALGIVNGTPETFDPARHFFQEPVDGVFMVLVVMSALTLAMSLFLVVNTVTAVVTEQVPQIGIMKAVGARPLQVFRVYLSNVVVYIGVALLIAIPLGLVATYALSSWILGMFNMEAIDLKLPLTAVAAQVATGLASPLLAALWPVTAAARTTVRDAISGYGLAVKVGLIEKGINRLRSLPPLVVLTAGNTFRKKGRLTMTLIALVAGGSIFMMVMSVQHSMLSFFDDFLETYRFDIILGFSQPQRVENIEKLVGDLPGVDYAEVLQFDGGLAVRRVDDLDGADEEPIELIAVSKRGQAYSPDVREGRFLVEEDGNAIAFNQYLAGELGVGVGDEVVIELGGKDTRWRIVGLIKDINANQAASVVWMDSYLRELGQSGKASTLFVGVVNDDPRYVTQMARDLRDWLDALNRDVGFSLSASEFKSQNIGGLMIIVYLLAVLALLIAVVGSIGLSGALSISALERRKEIGVMRAIGASGRAVGLIFVGEGMFIGFLSWLIAVPLSYPLGYAFSKTIGDAIDFDFDFKYSPIGAGIWLVVVLILSVVASGVPAWKASRTSVREVLAYA